MDPGEVGLQRHSWGVLGRRGVRSGIGIEPADPGDDGVHQLQLAQTRLCAVLPPRRLLLQLPPRRPGQSLLPRLLGYHQVPELGFAFSTSYPFCFSDNFCWTGLGDLWMMIDI
ncbi:hypothetical protein KSP39_PZI002713 [Platanthera zijinensis]|uniref:Uncharacterized protein n=1 Tax=Platanthera zijinensis TaxID=2320716 RepID=A0AAP0C098_9ASPA